jgi:hypothetical protein
MARTYNGLMNNGIEIRASERRTRNGWAELDRSRSKATGDPSARKEVSTMAKKDEGTRDTKKGKEREQ